VTKTVDNQEIGAGFITAKFVDTDAWPMEILHSEVFARKELLSPQYAFEHAGKRYRLQPKEDLSPYELYKVWNFSETLRYTPNAHQCGDLLVKIIEAGGIERHFEITELK
jgi:hypothetical protein